MLRWIRRPGPSPTVGELLRAAGGELEGACPVLRVEAIGPADSDAPVTLAPFWHRPSAADAARCRAAVLLVDASLPRRVAAAARARGIGLWRHPRPRRALRAALERLYEPSAALAGLAPGPAPGSLVHPEATVHRSARLGPGAIVGPGVVLDRDVRVGPGAIVVCDARVGAGSAIGPGCVVGAEGFGLDAAAGDLAPEALPHVGSVAIGRRVTLAALVVVARGTLGATAIGDGTQIDAHVQVGHNVRIGRGCVLCAQVGIGGSTRVGDGVWIGGQAGIADHCLVGDGARIAAQSGVIGDVPAGAVWGGTPAVPHAAWMRGAAAARRLARGRKG